MYTLVASKRFQRQLKNFLKYHPDVEPIVTEVFSLLQKNPHHQILKTHKLSGVLKNLLAARITYEYRVVFYIEKESIYLLAIGTHDEVY